MAEDKGTEARRFLARRALRACIGVRMKPRANDDEIKRGYGALINVAGGLSRVKSVAGFPSWVYLYST